MKSPVSKLLLIIVILVLLQIWTGYKRSRNEAAETAFAELNQMLRAGPIGELSLANNPESSGDLSGPDETAHIRTLLNSKSHWNYLEDLAAVHDQFVFDPRRRSVYFLHPRAANPKESCLGRVTITENGSGSHAGHAGMPPYLLLETLKWDQNALRIEGSILNSINWQPNLNGTEVVAGQQVAFRVDVDRFEDRTIGFVELGAPLIE
ncbi:MAG: hypothetical protein H8E15_08205 [Planctomycetes bacterium]|nr:hypothetical protein [Planctomycetota bacterium]